VEKDDTVPAFFGSLLARIRVNLGAGKEKQSRDEKQSYHHILESKKRGQATFLLLLISEKRKIL
jgi:hypothetical protein